MVIFRKGKVNIAHFLSPNPSPPTEEETAEEDTELQLSDDLERAVVKSVREQHNNVTMNTIRQKTIEREDLQFLIKHVKKGKWKRYRKDPRIAQYKTFMYEISEVDEIIYKGKDIIIIPETLTNQITDTMHKLRHNGDTNLIALIKQYFYYPSLHAQSYAIAKSCPLCQWTKLSKRKEPYGFRPLPARPFSEISLDHKTLDNVS